MFFHTNIKSTKKQNNSAKKKEQYNKWLASHGITDQNKTPEFKPLVVSPKKCLRQGSEDLKTIKSKDDTILGALPKPGIMGDYHKLSESDRKIVDKMGQCIAPTHKGAYTYVTPGMNPASLGRKNEVL